METVEQRTLPEPLLAFRAHRVHDVGSVAPPGEKIADGAGIIL